MARTRSVDFLPPIFQTQTNRQFLSATLDQLIQEPRYTKKQGFIGRRVGPGVTADQEYVLEPNSERQNYQLEPGVLRIDPDNSRRVIDAITYPGINDALQTQGGIVDRADRLYTSEFYTWDPFVDIDKFINYGQYYWLPSGPDAVDVSASVVPLTDDFVITRTDNGYTVSGLAGINPTINLVRGGSYTFTVNQPGSNFWIQTTPGLSGQIPATPNISGRDVLGVSNNGEDSGVITFNVPEATAQEFYYNLTNIGTVDLVTSLQYEQIQGQSVVDFMATYGGIDGITSLDGRSLIFDTPQSQDPNRNIWLITYVSSGPGNLTMNLSPVSNVNNFDRFSIQFGNVYSSTNWYKNASGYFEQIPLLTAVLDNLYYQDSVSSNAFGRIKLVNVAGETTLDISDILGKKNYTSPNGVTFTNNLKVTFRGSTNPASYSNQTYYVAGVGTAIELLPVGNYITPEPYTNNATVPFDSTPYDSTPYDSALSQPLEPDYLVMALNSPDLNAWSRTNRWFHIDVINASAVYNNTVPVVDNAQRAKRPILEYRGGLKLFNMGTQAKAPVNIIDLQETDALSRINGQLGYGIDGYNFIEGTRVIFAADNDPAVRNKIYVVNFISPDAEDGSTMPQPIINLVPAEDAEVLTNQCVVCINGITLQGKSFWFNGIEWQEAQNKIRLNQPPLFDIFDSNGISFSDPAVYPSSNFTGTKLFSYAVGNGSTDPVLNFALEYFSLSNVGDIVFDNNFYTDTFIYTSNSTSTTKNISDGFVKKYIDRVNYEDQIGWLPAATASKIYQQFSFSFAPGETLRLDVAANPVDTVPSVKVYIDNVFQDPGTYVYTVGSNYTDVTFANNAGLPGSVVEILVLSDQPSQVGFYQVPCNLENNPFNVNSPSFTLGTVRTHYETIAQNLLNFSGQINGANNIRDLGNVLPYGLNILQQSAPLTLAGYFLRSQQYNIWSAIQYNSQEYEKFKAQLLNAVVTNDYTNLDAGQMLTAIITDLTQGRTDLSPFYWSDMLPHGNTYIENVYSITPITTNVFDTVNVYNYTSANYQGLLVYLNKDTLLIRGTDYDVSVDAPNITVTIPLQVGDTITIQEYASTAGSFVPNTPTKMGLYPAFKPEIYLDTTYVTPTVVIRGHDGSITKAFGDIRDQLLLQFEIRIYNNLKLDGNPVPLTVADVVPGQFRSTDYSLNEINSILSQDFLTWASWNKLDYKTQTYTNNQFTWNYQAASNKLSPTNGPLRIGAWRGIYNYFYDTDYPHTRPWEMLGLTQQPDWWEIEYGPAPYTVNNLVLWDDLEMGLVRDPNGPYILPQYARPGLSNVIPTGTEGQLLSPLESVVGNYDSNTFRASWTFGDGSPVEQTWRTSSSYPFAVMRLLSLTRPAEFFSLFADRDLYRYNANLQQYLYNGRYRLDANGIQVYGDGISKASYINWIVDYNRVSGINSTEDLTIALSNLDVRLCYRMAGFSAKNLIQVYAERSSPNSLNSSLLLPDESYNLMFYKNVPFAALTYSSVIVQVVEDGYAVYGFSTTNPYFEILASQFNGEVQQISAGGATVTVPSRYSDTVVKIPYGYVFTNKTVVADFLLSYGAYLQSQGLVFESRENGYVLDWNQMVSEFLYWSTQGWSVGSVINLNPAATKIMVTRPQAVVDSVVVQTQEQKILNQNFQPLNTRDLIIDRYDNTFVAESITGETINLLSIKFVTFEHLMVFDNVSIFADLIYDPATGARQSRLEFVGTTTTDWNGQLDAPGFVLNQDNIEEWQPYRKYAKGDIVLWKNNYYSANDIVQPGLKFNINEWSKSDYTKIQQGLLPNLANKSDQLANAYSIYTANLERDLDLLAYGLTGFRPRQYMAALNLSDVSQVNLYSQFLPIKGTIRAAEIFKFADLGRGVAEFDIFENWAILRATYGANANRSFYELRLNEALLTQNPSIVQVINVGESSQADQTVTVDNIWKSSYRITNPNILTTTFVTNPDTALPDAGYVNLDDVDITVFDINDPTNINANLNSIGVGTTIWAAKINNYDWGIFRADKVPGEIVSVRTNLNGTSVVSFNRAHGLAANEILIVRFFDTNFDGTYRVLSVPDIYSVIVTYTFANPQQLQIVGTSGIGFKLSTQRVSQASDVVNLSYTNSILPGAKVWVDDDGTGHWQVIEKTDIFTPGGLLIPASQSQNGEYGYAVSQAENNLFAIVGAPGYNSNTGIVYTFVKTGTNSLGFNGSLELFTTDLVGFGSSVDVGNQTYTAIGAPQSGNGLGYVAVIYRIPTSQDFFYRQLLVPPANDLGQACEFGASVVISDDEHWLYVGAPGVNKVYAYGLVEVQNQSVSYITDGDTNAFNYSNTITIDNTYPEQLTVVLNNQLLVYGVDYVQTANDIVFGAAVVKDLKLTITRRTSVNFTGDGSTTTFSLYNYLYTATTLDAFKVEINGIVQRPNIDYEFLSTAGDIYFFTAPALNDLIVVSTGSYYSYVDEIQYLAEFNGTLSGTTLTVNSITNNGAELTVGMKLAGGGVDSETTIIGYGTGSGGVGTYTVDRVQSLGPVTMYARLNPTARFGTSVTCSTDGQQLVVGAPVDRTVDVDATGTAYVFNRSVENYLVSAANTTTFTPAGTLQSPTEVAVNGVFLVNTQYNSNGDFTVVGNSVELAQAPAIGDIVSVSVNLFKFVQKLSANAPLQGSRYGQAMDMCASNCSLFIGAPSTSLLEDEIVVRPSSGAVYRLINQARVYGTITSINPNPALTAGDTICVNGIEIAVPTSPNNTVAGLAAAINAAGIPNAQASVGVTGTLYAGRMTVSVINYDAAMPLNKVSVTPGQVGTAFYDLGFETLVQTQIIVPPVAFDYGEFGSSVTRDFYANTLVVGAPRASTIRATTFDGGTTYFDSKTTNFFQVVAQSGAVYTYDYLDSSVDSVTTPGQFVFGQQLNNVYIQSLDQFGFATSYRNGVLLVGSPGHDTGDSTLSELNYGGISLFNNPTQSPAWVPIHTQQPVVDIKLINNVYSYDRITSAKTTFFDFFDPLQGKILGAARQNIDFIGAIDPASYNIGPVNNYGRYWGAERVGEIWWDTNSVRFIDPNQDDVVYAAKRWGQVFPGSSIDIYQWVSSTVPPAQYTGAGTPKSIDTYVTTTGINDQGFLIPTYYFWVRNSSTVNTNRGKTLSSLSIARYIENPRSSGIPYVAFLSASATGIYNAIDDISAQDTVLSIEYDRQYTDDAVHTQFDLIPQDRNNGFLPDILYRKLVDSFCGADTSGNLVPDPFLSDSLKYGVQFRPRQSMFVDRLLALQNYIVAANNVFLKYPIVESRNLSLLNSEDPEPSPSSGQWNKRVADLEELSWQPFATVPVGYKYLVASDSRQNGLWTIYEVTAEKTFESLNLVAVQTYDTKRYWTHVDWYRPGYNSSIVPVTEVATFNLLQTLSVPVGSSVKVANNAQGKFEIYLLTNTGWERVGLQDGTLQILDTVWNYAAGKYGFDSDVFDNQGFDSYPAVETRKIIEAINQQILVGDLLIERNRLLILMFNFVLTEQLAPEWLTKTSLIDVDHKIRQLEPFQVYRADNQDFVVDYIQEVKPYHVQVRELNLIYDKLDTFQGALTDFDVPAYYNTELTPDQFISPILTPYTYSQATGTGIQNTDSDTPPDSPLWQTWPYIEWFSNYLLSVQALEIIDGGAGYLDAPIVTITGNCVRPAQVLARVNSAGVLIDLVLVDAGEGYSESATITISGGGLPENARTWQPFTEYFSGQSIITNDRKYYTVTGSGTSSGDEPTHTSGAVVNGDLLLTYVGTNALARIEMGNQLVRSIKTTIKYDRYEYTSNIVNWNIEQSYTAGDQVRHLDLVWQANSAIAAGEFNPDQWTLIPAGDLSGVNRTQGYYTPAVNEPGLQLGLLIDGIDYPGVQVDAPDFNQNTGYDIGNFDINPFDNISIGPEGFPTYDPAILDTIYQSFFGTSTTGPIPTGTAVTDINVDGGEFVDTYSSHAPEELIPGAEFDTLDFRVYTTPGADWENNGHGFAWKTIKWEFNATSTPDQSFSGVLEVPVQVRVTNQTQGRDLVLGLDYAINWENFIVEILSRPAQPPAANGDVIVLSVFGIGGGNQLLLTTGYNGAEIGDQVVIGIGIAQIEQMAIFVNGNLLPGTDYSLVGLTDGRTRIDFVNTYTSSDFVCINAIGLTLGVDYSWSTPITQNFVADGGLSFVLDNYAGGTNPANMVVEIDGVRARTPQGACYTADGSTAYQLPTRGGYSQSLIADNDVQVWIDNQLQRLYVDYTLEPFVSDSDVREIIFITAPPVGSYIVISVTTRADYVFQLSTNTLTFRTSGGFYPNAGQIVSVTTWNDTAQQGLCTLLWQGPATTGGVDVEPYDSEPFDTGSVNNGPGSYDYSAGTVVIVNDFQLGRTIADPTRLWVTKNGNRLFYGDDYLVVGEELVIHGPPVNPNDVVVVTMFTDSVVPGALTFRIFQDMRNVQATYRITQSTTTYLVQPLSTTDDTIYVYDASALTIPNLAANIWGMLTINGERIMYRELDLVTNSVTGLRRGTYGTGVDDHPVNSDVYNIGRGNLAPAEYQDRVVLTNTLADGSTNTFVADNIDLSLLDPAFAENAIQVFVGGTRQIGNYTVDSVAPATVTLDTTPPSGVQVTVSVRQGFSWYEPGAGTASNGIPLQLQTTVAADFFRGN